MDGKKFEELEIENVIIRDSIERKINELINNEIEQEKLCNR